MHVRFRPTETSKTFPTLTPGVNPAAVKQTSRAHAAAAKSTPKEILVTTASGLQYVVCLFICCACKVVLTIPGTCCPTRKELTRQHENEQDHAVGSGAMPEAGWIVQVRAKLTHIV
jgi:hypothetical protein